MVRVAYYFYRLRQDTVIYEFCVANSGDPNQFVETPAPDGTLQRWRCHDEGDLVVFTSPDGYTGGPVGWCYDRRLQEGRPMARRYLEHYAQRCKVSA